MIVTKLKRYLLFAGEEYYPKGGMDDFSGSFDTANEAHERINQLIRNEKIEWWHIMDLSTGAIIHDNGNTSSIQAG
jgi:hypothetical protein